MLIACQLVLMHTNDLLDQRIIENGSFIPHRTSGSISTALKEMIDLVNSTLVDRNLIIEYYD